MTTAARARFGLCLVVAAVACRTLPSAVPLANSGAVIEDTGTDRDRRAPEELAGRPPEHESHTTAVANARAPASLPSASAADVKAPDAAAGDAGTPAAGWPGEYFGSDKLVRHVEEEPDDVELDDKAHTRVEQKADGALVISIVNSATDVVICALNASAQGTAAAIEPGQSCFGEDGLVASVTSGSATLSGDRLVLDFSGKLVPEDTDDDDDEGFEIDLEYHFEGRRQ